MKSEARIPCIVGGAVALMFTTSISVAQQPGNCQLGIASVDLDVNNVRAKIWNTGGLFWRGNPAVYRVPKATNIGAIYAAGIWIGGQVDGELRMVASDYGPWELWPGPLDDSGNPRADCNAFDRLYKVSRQDLLDYEETGLATSDLAQWPYELGAPVVDGDGDSTNYDLEAGDRPGIRGDQSIWWVMNDAAGEHGWSQTDPIGLEVQGTAFAFDRADHLGNTTFYEYKLVNKGGNRVEDTYFSIWVDPDLGHFLDDFVGSDTTLGLGFVYNGDENDQGGYGSPPPALGVDFFDGPFADKNDGIDNDRDGDVDEVGEKMPMTSFVYYDNDNTPQGNPDNAGHAYGYQRAIWKDKVPITFGGNGRGLTDDRALFMFPGDPVQGEYWSEENTDGAGGRNEPWDRRFLVTTGPFTLESGDEQTITFGIVWAQGLDRLDSVTKLREADLLAQAAFDVDFQLPPPPDAPRVDIVELDETVFLNWGNRPVDNNYLDQYEVVNPFIADLDLDDKTYNFEGYNVLQFESEADQTGSVIATYDIPNGVTRVFDVLRIDDITGDEIKEMSADGTDSGIRHSIQLEGLVNYTDYYFGVQAYAYNVNSTPKVVKSTISRVKVRPSAPTARSGGTKVNPESMEMVFSELSGHVSHSGQGGGTVEATVVDPSSLTGHTYEVRFYGVDLSDDPEHPASATNYDIVDVTTGATIFDGRSAVEVYGTVAPQSSNVLNAAGLSWTITGPDPDVLTMEAPTGQMVPAFVQVQGIGDDDACGPGAGSVFGCNEVGGNYVYASFNGQEDWAMWHLGDGPEVSVGAFAPNDFEVRVTDEGSYAYHPFTTGTALNVPFEVWDIGVTGPFGINNPADDVQMIVNVFSDSAGVCFFGFGETENVLGLGLSWTDRVYAYYPQTTYADWAAAIEPVVEADPERCPESPATDAASLHIDLDPIAVRPLQRLIWTMLPTSPNYREEMIPVGNVIRFLTTKPNLPGDVFTVRTEGFQVETGVKVAAQDALEMMAVVPNPYKGASDYEISNLEDVVRFTNLPEEVTIRVFTLSGTLVKTIVKSSPSTSIEWDLRTDDGLPIGSGMYLIHIEVLGVGEKVLKFGAVRKRAQFRSF